MNHIEIICGTSSARRWEQLLIEQLRLAGYGISIRRIDRIAGPNDRGLDRGLRLARRNSGPSLADPIDSMTASASSSPKLVIDITGTAPRTGVPLLQLEFMGRTNIADGLADMIASSQLPELVARLDGVAVARAAPMLDNRVLLGRLANGVLGAAVSLLLQTAAGFFGDRLRPIEAPAAKTTPPSKLFRTYLPHLARGLAERAYRKVIGERVDHWQVGYRLIDGPGVAETGRLDGAPFMVLPDDGKRFYADPFVVEHDGRHYLFVEDYPYTTRKGVISTAELGPDGRFSTPRVVIEEPHHLSYPQIITEGGEIYMLPEGSGGSELVLYRAEHFPDLWVRDTVLLSDTKIADATLLVEAGRYWLIGTARFSLGSSSDTMVIYSAPALRGPWTPHPLNPIVIDRTAARPGGAFVRTGGRIVLPVQNGSRSYGGGLGLMGLERLDDGRVTWGPVRAIEPGAAWARQGLHTLNRAGRLEVVDSTG